MLVNIFLLVSFLSKAEIVDISSPSSMTQSFYDILYLDELFYNFSDNCVEKSSTTIEFFISFKKDGYNRSDIYALFLCLCEKKINVRELSSILKNKKLFLNLNSIGCDFFDYKNKAYIFLNEKKLQLKEKELNLLENIIKKYFSTK
ncbi:MAG: hypothetical protein N2Z20_03475 [Elusimicrobiales bacterium]|nr:hypothetical protein [Elusimicrobiales bacterium]